MRVASGLFNGFAALVVAGFSVESFFRSHSLHVAGNAAWSADLVILGILWAAAALHWLGDAVDDFEGVEK